MYAASVPEEVTFVEVPRPSGISNFLIELPNGEPVGWLTYKEERDRWAAHLCPTEKFIPRREHFVRREDAERWVRSIANRGFD